MREIFINSLTFFEFVIDVHEREWISGGVAVHFQPLVLVETLGILLVNDFEFAEIGYVEKDQGVAVGSNGFRYGLVSLRYNDNATADMSMPNHIVDHGVVGVASFEHAGLVVQYNYHTVSSKFGSFA